GTLTTGAHFMQVFSTAGDFPYYCKFHGAAGGLGMSGVIRVTAGGSSTSSSTTTTTRPPGPHISFFFAEGTVRAGFQEYVTLQNPGDQPANVVIGYQASDDAGAAVPVASAHVTVPPHSRVTHDVAAALTSGYYAVSQPVNVSTSVT